ncbi:helix-turn-helix domain-containing protein [Herbidospora sp. RD11066]
MSEVPLSRDPSKRLEPNRVLTAARQKLGWSRRRAAQELHRLGAARGLPELDSIEKTIYRHEVGKAACQDPLYIELYCAVYKATTQELFGVIEPAQTSSRPLSGVRSHKFIPAYIGASRVDELIARESAVSAGAMFGLECHRVDVANAHGKCALYVWPFGVAMFHLVEELELPNLANLAIWRRRTYVRDMAWASGYLSEALSASVKASYVLSAYWVHAPSWQSHELDTAMRIMCIPRILHERDSEMSGASLAHAELVERSLLADGFEHSEMVSFGFKGISIGYASWSGVVYYPTAPRRALAESEIVNVELATQSMWSYCEFINTQIEQGQDPQVADQYGWRFLRGTRSRLTNARPQETEYHKCMRMAILDTSGTPDRLSEAIDIIRDTRER